jgi:hypothetical protein
MAAIVRRDGYVAPIADVARLGGDRGQHDAESQEAKSQDQDPNDVGDMHQPPASDVRRIRFLIRRC